jgi:hypothetical protein
MLDILPALKGTGIPDVTQEQTCITTTCWFLLLIALLNDSLHRLAPAIRRLIIR